MKVTYVTYNLVTTTDFLEQPEGNRPPGRPRRRWEDNIKMDFQEIG
jgi:hypothetical protein